MKKILVVGGALLLLSVAARADDAGKQIYQSKCRICHAVTAGQNRVGPSLYGVVGRKAGTLADYSYSDAMKNSGKTWDSASLDLYLTHPQTVVPGTKMSFAGLPDAGDRTAVIAFLGSLK